MENSKKSTKRTKTKNTQQADAATEANSEQQLNQDVSGAWTVVEENIVVDEKIEGNTVVHINNVEVEDSDAPATSMLYRHPTDKTIGGVCAGLANTLGWDPNIVRILWVAATALTFGGGIAAYIAFALLLPSGTPEQGVVTPATISIADKNSNTLSYVLMGVGAFILLSNIGLLGGLVGGLWRILSIGLFPAIMIGLGYMLLSGSGKKEWRKSVKDASASVNTRFQNKVNSVNGESVRSSFSKARSSLPLRRSTSDRMLMGVCGGLSQKLGVDANLIRFGWVILGLFSGIFPGVFAYGILSLVLPQDGAVHMSNNGEVLRTRQPRQEVQDVQIL